MIDTHILENLLKLSYDTKYFISKCLINFFYLIINNYYSNNKLADKYYLQLCILIN